MPTFTLISLEALGATVVLPPLPMSDVFSPDLVVSSAFVVACVVSPGFVVTSVVPLGFIVGAWVVVSLGLSVVGVGLVVVVSSGVVVGWLSTTTSFVTPFDSIPFNLDVTLTICVPASILLYIYVPAVAKFISLTLPSIYTQYVWPLSAPVHVTVTVL